MQAQKLFPKKLIFCHFYIYAKLKQALNSEYSISNPIINSQTTKRLSATPLLGFRYTNRAANQA